MITFALTGGIASGKSTVARLFAECGVPVIDADRIARLVVMPQTPAFSEIVARFGNGVLAEDGSLNRQALGHVVFSDPQQLAALNAIVHPAVQHEVLLQREKLQQQGVTLACYDVPLLFETGQTQHYRPVVVVTAHEELRIERMVARDGLDPEAARARLLAQIPLEQKVAHADIVIENNGTLTELHAAARDALERVRLFVT